MPEPISFDFAEYVRKRKLGGPDGAPGEESYAYTGDLEAQAHVRRLAPVVMAMEAIVRLGKNLQKNQLLGHAVLVTPKQFPKVHRLAAEAARLLGTPVPTVYVTQEMSLNAFTSGSETDSFIVLHSGIVDHLSDEELLFVLAHETGHIHNGHVTLLSVVYYLTHIGGRFFQAILTPALLALRSWSRRAEITCDRAGLMVVKDLEVAQRSLIKLGLGSKKLYEQIDIDEYLKQLEAGKEGLGKYAEILSSHPYLPKRVESLRIFSESRIYREKALGQHGGLDKVTIDARVANVIRVK